MKKTIVATALTIFLLSYLGYKYIPSKTPWKHILTCSKKITGSYTGATSITTAGFYDSESGIALFDTDYIYYTNDGGKNWFEAQKDDAAMYLSNLEIYKNHVWATGSNALRYSKNHGKTWQTLPSYGAIYKASMLSFCDSMHGWNAREQLLAMTEDGGHTWKQLHTPRNEPALAIGILSKNTGYTLYKNGLYKTTDRGSTWDLIHLPQKLQPRKPYESGWVHAVRFIDPKRGTIVLYRTKSRHSITVLQTKDGGTGWQKERIPLDNSVNPHNIYLSRDAQYLTISDTVSNRIHVYQYIQ